MKLSAKSLDELLPTIHHRVVTFARAHFAQEGVGVVVIALPAITTAAATIANMRYHSIAQIRQVMTDATGVPLAEAEIIVQMLGTYDPTREAVLAISLGEHPPLMMTLRFDPPVVARAPTTVH